MGLLDIARGSIFAICEVAAYEVGATNPDAVAATAGDGATRPPRDEDYGVTSQTITLSSVVPSIKWICHSTWLRPSGRTDIGSGHRITG